MDFIINKNDCRPRCLPTNIGKFPNSPVNRFGQVCTKPAKSELERYYFEQHLKQQEQKFQQQSKSRRHSLSDSQSNISYPIEDLMETNCIEQNTKIVEGERYFKFISTYVNLNSNCRLTNEKIIIRQVTELKKVVQELPPTQAINPKFQPKCTLPNNPTGNIISVYNTGGEIVTAIRDGSYLDCGQVPKPVCQSCQNPVNNSCICLINDIERLKSVDSDPITEKKIDQIMANKIKQNADKIVEQMTQEPDYMGYENLFDQIKVQSGIKTDNMPACSPCDNNLIQIKPPKPIDSRLKNNNTSNLGGLESPEYIEETLFCLDQSEINNRFIFKLDRKYTNVKIVKLISSCFPIYDTIINQYNNQIIFQLQRDDELILTPDKSSIWTYQIPEGNYTLDQLAEQIQIDINTLTGTDAFLIQRNYIRNQFKITTLEPYTFTWEFDTSLLDNHRSLYQMLGFSSSIQSDFTDIFSNNNRIRLKIDDYVLIKVKSFEKCSNNQNQLYDCITKDYYFNKITFQCQGDNICQVYDQHLDIETVFDNSNVEFEYLDLIIVNQDGLPINLNNNIFNFTIQIVEYSDRITGQMLNTRRGVIDYTSITHGTVQQFTQNQANN